MRNGNQPSGGTVTLVGMDAHTRVLSLCIAEWRHGSDPKVRRNIPGVLLEDMEEVYGRWVPEDALTLIESSGNTRVIVKRLKAMGRRAGVLNPCYKPSVSHASQQVVTNHLLSRIILQCVAVLQLLA